MQRRTAIGELGVRVQTSHIQHLEKVKKELQGSDNQLRIANNKVDDVSIKKLTKDNPTMQAKFKELKK